MPVVECVVPFLGGCAHRERAWGWLRERLPYPVRVGEGGSPWCKAEAVMPAVAASDAEIVVVHDADVFCSALPAAVEAVQDGAGWAIPHRGVFRLTEEATRAFMAGGELEGLETAERPNLGMPGGGIFVTRRETLLEVPFDLRFIGWGQEDDAIGLALTCLVGEPWRPTSYAPLVHLYHPPQARMNRKEGSLAGRALLRRYRQAAGDPARMRTLLKEAECSPT